MHDTDWLAERFEEHRSRLTSVAYRMLGATSDADNAVQEAWLRLSRSDPDSIENMGGWLTTVLSRVCLKHPAGPPLAAGGAARPRRVRASRRSRRRV